MNWLRRKQTDSAELNRKLNLLCMKSIECMKAIDFFQSARLWFALFLYSAVCFLVGNTPHLRGGKAECSCLSFCARFADVKWKLNDPSKLKFLAKESVRCGEMVWNKTDNLKLLFENLAGQGLCKNFLHVRSDEPQSVNFSKCKWSFSGHICYCHSGCLAHRHDHFPSCAPALWVKLSLRALKVPEPYPAT